MAWASWSPGLFLGLCLWHPPLPDPLSSSDPAAPCSCSPGSPHGSCATGVGYLHPRYLSPTAGLEVWAGRRGWELPGTLSAARQPGRAAICLCGRSPPHPGSASLLGHAPREGPGNARWGMPGRPACPRGAQLSPTRLQCQPHTPHLSPLPGCLCPGHTTPSVGGVLGARELTINIHTVSGGSVSPRSPVACGCEARP